MKSKTNNTKVPKSDKTKLSDMRPKKDAQGGGPAPTGPVQNPPGTGPVNPPQGGKGLTLPPY
jgi:hypothetical protein